MKRPVVLAFVLCVAGVRGQSFDATGIQWELSQLRWDLQRLAIAQQQKPTTEPAAPVEVVRRPPSDPLTPGARALVNMQLAQNAAQEKAALEARIARLESQLAAATKPSAVTEYFAQVDASSARVRARYRWISEPPYSKQLEDYTSAVLKDPAQKEVFSLPDWPEVLMQRWGMAMGYLRPDGTVIAQPASPPAR